MSYPAFENHGAFYDNSSNDPNTKDAYHPGQSSRSSAPVPANSVVDPVSSRQSSYGGATYNSSSQDQQNYGAESRETLSYAKSMWSGINGQDSQQPAHDFRRQQSSLDNQSTYSGAGQDFYSSNTQSATQQSTQGLDNLAYVSGAVLHGANHGIMIGGAGPTDFSAHRNTGVFQACISSPAQTTSQTYSNQRPASTYSAHGYNGSGSPHQDLTASLAAALAGAVSRRQSNQRPASATHAQPSPLSPNMGNAPSRDGYNTQPSHRAALPYSLSAINASRGTQQSTRQSPTPSLLHTNLPTQRYPNSSRLDPAESRPMTKPEGQDILRNKGKPSSQCRSQTTNNSVQSNDRIEALATNSSPRDSLLPTLQQQATPSEAIPSFVDQNQVFTSYRKDYDRREREAAETEGETATEAAGTSSEEPTQKSEAWTQIGVPNDSIAPRPVTSSPSVPGKPQKPGGREEKRTGSVPPATTSPRTSIPSQTVSDVDPGMASEMRAMIERMREWKNKDPSMFSKLWEEMKRGGAVTSARIGSTRAPSTQATQAEIPQNPSTDTAAAASASKVADTRKIPSPRLAAQLDGFHIVVENNKERLPDLGRFPAERQSPPKYSKSDANDSIRRDEVSSTAPTESPPVQAVTSRSQPVLRRPPTRTSSGDTIWPEEKRMALAEAAVTALNTDPANRDKGITVQTIRDMLEQNPSYIDLCKLLEDRGLRFHRGQFARRLLANVPDLATTQPKAGSELTQTPVRVDAGRFPTRPALAQNITMPSEQGVHPSYMNGPHPGSVKVETPPHRAMPTSQFLSQTPNSDAQRSFSTTKPVGTPIPQATKASLGVPSPNISPPVPGSKAAMSRKRDFSEFVDLTQLNDDEDYVMPSKRPHFEEPSPSPDMFNVGTDISSHGFLSVRQPPQGQFAFTRSPQFSPHQPLQAHGPLSQAAHPPRAILARPIIKAEALRKSYYDPKTVARDILIAAGRHPSERPLNAHYAGLLHRHIELDSDLSTFEWDAVDPGGPPMPQVHMVDIPAGPPKWKLGVARRGRGHVRVDEPIRGQSAQDANATPAIASLARLSAQTKNLLQGSQQAATAPGQNSSVPHQSQVVEDTFQDDIGAIVTPQKRKASLERSPKPSRIRSHPSSSPRKPKSVESEHNMQNSGGKRRGRPPGAKNKHPSLATMKKGSNTTLVSIPSRPRSPSPIRFDVYDCQWRKCNAKLHNLPTLRRHISKVHQPSPEEATRWGYTCWWKKCRTLVRNEDKTVTPKERFQSHSEWMEHISQEHLHPLGMEKGDGPSTSHIGKHQLNLFDVNKYLYQPRDNVCEPPARIVSYTDPQSIAADRATYLSDERGRIVAAPRTEATNDEYVPDALILAPVSNDAEERVPIKQYMRAHGNEKMDLRTSASEILRAMEVKKERVGPGMDRGGCTLVNNERRATLLQNEDISRVVVDDD